MQFSCNVCGGVEVGRSNTRGDGKQVLFCADCGMGVVEDPPTSTDAFYADGYYDRRSSEDPGYIDYAFSAEHGLLWVQLMVQALAPNGGRVLDVGCADGFLLHRLEGDSRRFGIEVNAAAQAQARTRGVTILGDDIMSPRHRRERRAVRHHHFNCHLRACYSISAARLPLVWVSWPPAAC